MPETLQHILETLFRDHPEQGIANLTPLTSPVSNHSTLSTAEFTNTVDPDDGHLLKLKVADNSAVHFDVDPPKSCEGRLCSAVSNNTSSFVTSTCNDQQMDHNHDQHPKENSSHGNDTLKEEDDTLKEDNVLSQLDSPLKEEDDTLKEDDVLSQLYSPAAANNTVEQAHHLSKTFPTASVLKE